MSAPVRLNKQGQILGRKGQETRSRLMDAARRLLRTQSPFELTAVGIAGEACISPATFYMYFDDTRDILYALSEVAGEDMARVHAIFDEPWSHDSVEQRAATVIDALNEVWDRHRPVLRYRNLEATRGDPRFVSLRMNTFLPFIDRFAKRILSINPAVPGVRKRADAYAEASILHGAMEHMAATDREVMAAGLGVKRVNANIARIVALTVCRTTIPAESAVPPPHKRTASVAKAPKAAGGRAAKPPIESSATRPKTA
jgi:AcrR family transcriptional regulator